ncbi:MAG: hypothetical protein GY874_17805, partial [Desulfobacteraceae bacterium]|nr:hypothetical protein [Desulfobacteraceae bacterium]
MANYSPLKFTKQGKELQAKVQVGAELTFKHIAVGSGEWQKENHDVNAMTQLVEQQTTIDITEVKKLADPGKWLIQGIIAPGDYTDTGYRLRECGIYAEDPDSGTILYMATNASPADYIPGMTEEIVYTTVLNFVLTISDEANVTVKVDNAAAATKYDLALHEQLQLDPEDTDPAKIKHLSNAQAYGWQAAMAANTAHRNRTDNPHGLNKGHINLDKVPNLDFTQPVEKNTNDIEDIYIDLGKKALLSHLHDDRYCTENEIDTKLTAKSNTNHTHDSRYYTESEISNLLSKKSATNHTHDSRYYTESEISNLLSKKSATN